jgi:hypothetical protein
MTVPALDALAAAKAAGINIFLNGDAVVLEARPKLPAEIVAQLKANKPELLCILSGRQAAKAAIDGNPPPDCPGERWGKALHGLQSFVRQGWVDKAVARMDGRRALPGAAGMATARSHRRGTSHWRGACNRGDRSLDRHRNDVGIAA